MRRNKYIHTFRLATFLAVFILLVTQIPTSENKSVKKPIFEPIPIYRSMLLDNLPEQLVLQAEQGVVEKYLPEEKALMKIAKAEAGIDGVDGMCMVIAVVLNRVESPKFPDTIEEVILQYRKLSNGQKIYQFSTVQDGTYQKAEINSECEQALQKIQNGEYSWVEALYFENAQSSWQQENCEYLYTVGHHRFYK